MISRLCVAAALLAAAAPVLAQNEIMGQQIGEAQRNALRAAKAMNSNDARAKRVIANISCVGAQEIADVIAFAKDNLKIEFVAQTQPSRLAGKTIKLDEALPDYPRIQIAYVVYEAAAAYGASFPESIEKEYMRVSLAVRGWMELGGQGNQLPVLEPRAGYKDESLGGLFRAWYYGGIEERIARNNPKLASLKTLKDDKAAKSFEAFKKAETDWILANGFRFQQ